MTGIFETGLQTFYSYSELKRLHKKIIKVYFYKSIINSYNNFILNLFFCKRVIFGIEILF